MDIDRIITMASQGVRIQFLAFERSLRTVGCDLPLLVIPYDQEDGFDLPRNAEWWQKEEFTSWLKEHQGASIDGEVRLSHRGKLRIFHTDICFIEDCRTTLAQRTGFVVADTELIKYGEASTQESMEVLSRETSFWSLKLFNTGHFASDTPLYSLADLESTCEKYKETCLLSPHHEQPGINLLALVSGVTFTTLCLPPHNMESTMAIDYAYRDDWEETWKQGRPYFIHYAGGRATSQYPISRIFFDFLTESERMELMAAEEETKKEALYLQKWPLLVRVLNRVVGTVDRRFHVQPKPYDVLRDEAVEQ